MIDPGVCMYAHTRISHLIDLLAYELAQRMESKCTVLFFDEIDALGLSRGDSGREQISGGSDSCSRRVLAELLIQLNRISNPTSPSSTSSDGIEEGVIEYSTDNSDLESDQESQQVESAADNQSSVRVIVVAATNRQHDCDPALLRRFGIRVHVGLPDAHDRRRILKRLLKGIANSLTKVELHDLAEALQDYSGSDLESLTREAAMAPVRECIRAAALKKRQARRSEQSGGDSSQEGGTRRTDPHQQARDSLLSGFQTMRPVSLEDFETAVDFLDHGHQSFGPRGSSGQDDMKHKSVHYDSSSDSEEEE